MRVLILYANAGGGHKSAAMAAKAYLEKALPQAEVRAEDGPAIFDQHAAIVQLVCCKSYEWMAGHAPWMFGAGYHLVDHRGPFGEILPSFNGWAAKQLLPYLNDFQPDVILSTFHFCGNMISILRKKGRTDAKLIQLITDYAPCMPWMCRDLNAYVTAHESMLSMMTARGAKAETVHPLGIPIRPAFFEQMDRAELRKQLGMDPDLPAVLLMGGSFGVKKMLKMYESIAAVDMPMQIIALCGKSEAVLAKMTAAAAVYQKPHQVLGFRTDVECFMKAADLLVSKPGGLTVSEALACDLPIATYDAIPGQEEDNIKFLETQGMGARIPTKNSGEFVASLLADKKRMASMKKACTAFDKSSCMKELPALVAHLAGE